jgi:hypothetical protein
MPFNVVLDMEGDGRPPQPDEEMGREVNSLGPVRSALIAKGIIYSPGHGDMAFTVPLFDEFMKRMIPLGPK